MFPYSPSYQIPAPLSARDKYLAAVAQASAAEAEYRAYLQQQQALQYRPAPAYPAYPASYPSAAYPALALPEHHYDSYALAQHVEAERVRAATAQRQQDALALRQAALRAREEEALRIREEEARRIREEEAQRIRVEEALAQEKEEARVRALRQQQRARQQHRVRFSLPTDEEVAPHAEELPFEQVLHSLLGLTTTHVVPPPPAPRASAPADDEDEALLKLIFGRAASPADPARSKLQPIRPRTPPADTERESMLRLVFGQQPEPQPQQKPQPTKAPAARAQASAAPSSVRGSKSLKAQLEARLGNKYEVEVHDTIQALLASLASAPAPAPPARPTNRTASSSKGKARAAPAPTPAPVRPATPPHDLPHAYIAIDALAADLAALTASFALPAALDFDGGALAYTPRNTPVRAHEQALSALLVRLDAVESFGSSELRAARKAVVASVERALEELEAGVQALRTPPAPEAVASNSASAAREPAVVDKAVDAAATAVTTTDAPEDEAASTAAASADSGPSPAQAISTSPPTDQVEESSAPEPDVAPAPTASSSPAPRKPASDAGSDWSEVDA